MPHLGWTDVGASAAAAFLASLVEFVEALTIVLAVGTVRGWRGALTGAGLGLLLLIVLTSVFGPALAHIPLRIVQIVVGGLLLLFGLRWLRKAILRAAGIIPLHDEAAIYARETATLRPLETPLAVAHAAATTRLATVIAALDPIAVGTAFKIVLLEGIEVVFIVIAVGAGGLLLPASAGAAAALLLVIALGVALHRPLATIPENALKFTVGILLTAFGTFWVGEGVGVTWPGADWSLLALVAGLALVSLGATSLARAVSIPPAQADRT